MMDLILEFVSLHMRFLWKGAKFRIVGSSVSIVNGGSGELFLQSEILAMRITCDRRILMLEIGSNQSGNRAARSSDLYSIDLVKRLITGEWDLDNPFSSHDAYFVEKNLDLIESLFALPSANKTDQKMKVLKKERGRLMFG